MERISKWHCANILYGRKPTTSGALKNGMDTYVFKKFCSFGDFFMGVKNNAVGYEVLLAVNVKNVLFWDVTPYSSVDGYQCWGCRFLWNIGAGLLNCIVSHPKRLNLKECLGDAFFSHLLSHASWAKEEHAVLHAFSSKKEERQSDARSSHQKWMALASLLATCWSFVLHLLQHLYYAKTADFLR